MPCINARRTHGDRPSYDQPLNKNDCKAGSTSVLNKQSYFWSFFGQMSEIALSVAKVSTAFLTLFEKGTE
jgi:hypothetical protein